MIVGYARVSTTGQSLDVQRDQLRAAGAEKLFEEKKSATSRTGRAALEDALSWVRDGDVLLVTRLDRLARSVRDLSGIVHQLGEKGVGLKVLQQASIDTTGAEGRLLLNILASFAEWENDIRRDRQAEGIAKARAEGRYRGRPRTVDPKAVNELHAAGLGPAAIAKRLGVARSTVYRLLEAKGTALVA